MRCCALLLVAACSGAPHAVKDPGGNEPAPPACDSAAETVRALYRADAQQKEPKRVDEAVADNTAMAMNDCRKDPAKIAPCLQAAKSTDEIEHHCMIPLDPEGSEGDALK